MREPTMRSRTTGVSSASRRKNGVTSVALLPVPLRTIALIADDGSRSSDRVKRAGVPVTVARPACGSRRNRSRIASVVSAA